MSDNKNLQKKTRTRKPKESKSPKTFEEANMAEVPKKHTSRGKKILAKIAVDPKTYHPIVKLMDEGVQKEIDLETKVWNERLFTTEFKGTSLDRFPLSASQGGKCALALARNLSHYLGVANYPRSAGSISPRVQRIFARGHLLEAALIQDLGKFTPLKPVNQQQRVRLFSLGGGKRPVDGNIDSVLENEDGVRILTDFKSKGAFHSAAFQDTISQFFQELRQTGLVEEIHPNCFLITDAYALFKVISMDEFFVDYLIQLNSYAFSVDVETGEPLNVDFVSLLYENKNTCANYEVRWKPQKALFDFLESKFNYIYDNVRKVASVKTTTIDTFDDELQKDVPKEFALGSSRCKLCDYNEMCWGKYDPTLKPSGNVVLPLPESMATDVAMGFQEEAKIARFKEDVLNWMSKEDATHVTFSGMCYERKFLKSPKPHFELRQCKQPLRSDR